MTSQNQDSRETPSQQALEPAMRRVAGVCFSRAGKMEFFLCEGVELKTHDFVVVKGEHGNHIGRVVVPKKEVPADSLPTNSKSILRKARPEDIERHNQEMEKARECFEICDKRIKERSLPMKLVDVDLEEGKAIFFFFAEERVDFRSLVKDLAGELHMRIEMRQIGARDEAKAIGSIGPCGLVCCCERFLNEFNSISISMAKNQGLTPNPAKLTGMCGKLKCCLHYENETYTEARKGLPSSNAKVEIKEGRGQIISLDILKGTCQVRLDDPDKSDIIKCNCSDCKVIARPKKGERQDGGAFQEEPAQSQEQKIPQERSEQTPLAQAERSNEARQPSQQRRNDDNQRREGGDRSGQRHSRNDRRSRRDRNNRPQRNNRGDQSRQPPQERTGQTNPPKNDNGEPKK